MTLDEAIKETAKVLQQYVEGCDEFDAGVQVLAAARKWHTLTNLAASYEHAERVRQAVEEYDLALTVHEDVRLLAHGAVKSLELFDALTDTADPEEET